MLSHVAQKISVAQTASMLEKSDTRHIEYRSRLQVAVDLWVPA